MDEPIIESNQDELQVPMSVEIPSTVKDQQAYLRYLKLKKSAVLDKEKRLIYCSDSNIVIDPLGKVLDVQKKIVHLPLEEQEAIIKRTKGIKTIALRINALKKKAFGIKRTKYHSSLHMGILDERKSELIEYFGRMMSVAEVHKIVTVDWGHDIAKDVVRQFKKSHLDKIEKKEIEFQRDFSNLRLSHKKGRLEEMVFMYNSRKIKYEATQSKEDYKLMLATLRAIRDEVEDKSLRIDHNINAKLEITVNNHIQDEIMKGLTINDIIIARVASRMNINPRFLITRLHNSAYAKHSGFIRPDGDLDQQEIQYPSQMVYNWNAIEAQHAKHGDLGLEDAEWEDVTPDNAQSVKDVKDVLLAKLMEKKSDLSEAKFRINKNTTK